MEIESIMMTAFVAGLGVAVWKLYYFLPTKPLADDDTTPESVALLERIMIESHDPSFDHTALYRAMLEHPEFNPEHFWRFNENRLHHLIEHYRFKEPDFRR